MAMLNIILNLQNTIDRPGEFAISASDGSRNRHQVLSSSLQFCGTMITNAPVYFRASCRLANINNIASRMLKPD